MGVNQFSDLNEEEWLAIYGKGLHEAKKTKRLLLKTEWLDDEGPYDEKGRYMCRHDEEMHNFFDYNDYKYIDDELKHCNLPSVDWIKHGKVGVPKQQSTCGSCWAHSTIAAVETLYAQIQNVKHADNVTSFSE
jgi:hypothetical protein